MFGYKRDRPCIVSECDGAAEGGERGGRHCLGHVRGHGQGPP